MRKLTLKFREIVQRYDCTNREFNILTSLLDIILDMLVITDHEDTQVHIRKLSSFVKLLSSDFCQDIIDTDMIDTIYENQILPILLHFDHKYGEFESEELDKEVQKKTMYYNTDTKSLCNTEEVTEFEDKSEPKESNKVIPQEVNDEESEQDESDICKLLELAVTKFYDPLNTEGVVDSRGHPDADTERLFIVLKTTGDNVIKIYESVIDKCKSYDKEKALKELHEILTSVKITNTHPYPCVANLSASIYNLCKVLICSVEDNKDLVNPSKSIAKKLKKYISEASLSYD